METDGADFAVAKHFHPPALCNTLATLMQCNLTSIEVLYHSFSGLSPVKHATSMLTQETYHTNAWPLDAIHVGGADAESCDK